MRVVSSTDEDILTVIRGSLATRQTNHDNGSRITKIKPIAVEFRRPSITRASGHTFEYLGYGPGNYSTGLPQVQVTTLSEREEFLVQSQERSGGVVVYNGINSNGDVFNGNTKTSAASGQIVSYDIPKPTITGQDPNRLSVVFDEVTVKERLVVEGGNSNTVLSQFNGPVTFGKEVKIKDAAAVTGQLKITNTTQSTTTATGALVVSGGAGIAQNLNVGGNTNLTGTLGVTGALNLTSNLNINTNKFNVTATTGNTVIDGSLTVNSGIGITAAKFVKNGATATNFLKAGGADSALTFSDITAALNYTPANAASISSAEFPEGNSRVCDQLAFNGTLVGGVPTGLTDFTLRIGGSEFTPAGSVANLIVSLGGVIQRPGTDFIIVESPPGTNTSTIRFSQPPLAGTNHFIVALGGQGSLLLNKDWTAKGQIIVAIANNSAAQLNVGANNTILTADSTTGVGVSWKNNVNVSGTITGSSFSGNGITPIGGIIMWSGTIAAAQALTGWALCDGTNGTPNLTNRFIVGAASDTGNYGWDAATGAVSGNYAPGNTGGQAAHQLTIAELASHNHSLSGLWRTSPNPISPYDGWAAGNRWSTSTTGTSGSQGGNQYHENRPPYYALAFIMRTA
jgi:hypothetical protein